MLSPKRGVSKAVQKKKKKKKKRVSLALADLPF
jgi:hypothetical protein